MLAKPNYLSLLIILLKLASICAQDIPSKVTKLTKVRSTWKKNVSFSMTKTKNVKKRTHTRLTKTVRMTTYPHDPTPTGFLMNDSMVSLDEFYDVDFDSDIYFPEKMDNVKHGIIISEDAEDQFSQICVICPTPDYTKPYQKAKDCNEYYMMEEEEWPNCERASYCYVSTIADIYEKRGCFYELQLNYWRSSVPGKICYCNYQYCNYTPKNSHDKPLLFLSICLIHLTTLFFVV